MDTTTQPHPHTLLTSTYPARPDAEAEAQRRHDADGEPQLVWHAPFGDKYVVLARSVRPGFRTDGVVYSTETPEQRAEAQAEHEAAQHALRGADDDLERAAEQIRMAEDALAAARQRYDERAAAHEVVAAWAHDARTAAGEY